MIVFCWFVVREPTLATSVRFIIYWQDTPRVYRTCHTYFTNSLIQVAKMKNRKTKTVEEMTMAERERERLKVELDEAEDQVCMKCTKLSIVKRLFV